MNTHGSGFDALILPRLASTLAVGGSVSSAFMKDGSPAWPS